MQIRRTWFALVLFALSASSSPAQTVFTEDFETPDTANFTTYSAGQFIVTATTTWNVTANSVDLYEGAARSEAAVFDGAQAVDLTGSPGAGVLETVFATTPGTTYQLVFHYARNALLDPETGDAQVEVIGSATLLQDLIQHDPNSHSFDEYLQYSGVFTADGTQATLRFTALDVNVAGVTIDGISVFETSAIPTLSIWGYLCTFALLMTTAVLTVPMVGRVAKISNPRDH